MTPEYDQDREMWKQQTAESLLGMLLGERALGNQAYSARDHQLQNDMRDMSAGAFMNESRAGERWERIERYALNPNWWWRLMTTAWLLGVAGVVLAVWAVIA